MGSLRCVKYIEKKPNLTILKCQNFHLNILESCTFISLKISTLWLLHFPAKPGCKEFPTEHCNTITEQQACEIMGKSHTT